MAFVMVGGMETIGNVMGNNCRIASSDETDDMSLSIFDVKEKAIALLSSVIMSDDDKNATGASAISASMEDSGVFNF
eukprot:CAMPEP_0195536150 /NCGR_PEP_ID=MMETSP0794_2-20130614/45551_1 /TAXON_ID=515487 /ORGANISM="Stephanopyxis turris, Strain CCMP 815" /LENGTH=76 /DNA_ID=CAMNT_0040669469 /DNA_START=65 /DNA_END=292 /DNA_ORIENTATION=+